MHVTWRSLAVIQLLVTVVGATIFLVSFSTLHWTTTVHGEGTSNETVVAAGIWSECVYVNGSRNCDSLIHSDVPHWHRHMQAWEAVGLVVLTASLLLGFVSVIRTTRHQLMTLAALNFGAGIAILIGTATLRNNMQGSPDYSYVLAILSTTIFFIAGVINIAQINQLNKEYVEPRAS